MTNNAIAYQKLMEDMRHNIATEKAKQQDIEIANRNIELGYSQVGLGYSQLGETQRANAVKEMQNEMSIALGQRQQSFTEETYATNKIVELIGRVAGPVIGALTKANTSDLAGIDVSGKGWRLNGV